jgi:hypothetical protein
MKEREVDSREVDIEGSVWISLQALFEALSVALLRLSLRLLLIISQQVYSLAPLILTCAPSPVLCGIDGAIGD